VFVRRCSNAGSIIDLDLFGVRCEGVLRNSCDLARTNALGGNCIAPSSVKFTASESKSGRSESLFCGAYMLSSSGRYLRVEGIRATTGSGLDITGLEEHLFRTEKLARSDAFDARDRPWFIIFERCDGGGRGGVAGI
jgi:hypothetical protein